MLDFGMVPGAARPASGRAFAISRLELLAVLYARAAQINSERRELAAAFHEQLVIWQEANRRLIGVQLENEQLAGPEEVLLRR